MKKAESDQKKALLAWKKWSLAIALFVAGYIAYYLTAGLNGFFPELLHHIGLFLAAVVAVHFIYELLVKRDEQVAMRREISDAVATTINAFMPSFEKWGFQGFEDALEYKVIFEKLLDGDELLWLDTYAPSRIEVVSLISTALENGANIKMLAIAPESNTAKLRAREIEQLGFTEQAFSTDLSSFIDQLRQVESEAGSLEVRLYDDLPCVPMYIHRRGGVPIRGFTSYFLSHASENFAHARWGFGDDGMLKYFAEYFDRKWTHAKPIKPVSNATKPPHNPTLQPTPLTLRG